MPLIQIDLPADKDVLLEANSKEAMRSKRSQATIMLIERIDQVEADKAAAAAAIEAAAEAAAADSETPAKPKP